MDCSTAFAVMGGLVGLDLWRRTGWTGWVASLLWSAVVRLTKCAAWHLRAAPTTFGSARWLQVAEARRLGLLGDTGLIVGKMAGGWFRPARFLRCADVEGSVVVMAPMGAGKGAGVVIPNLLTYRGSVICTDPKGENVAITARQRRTFGPVYCLDVGRPDRSHRFNPMDTLTRDPMLVAEDCKRLAELLMPKAARDEDDHWRLRSVSILTGVLAYVLDRYGDDPLRCNLATVDKLLSAPKAELEDTLADMLMSPQMVARSVAGRLLTSLDSEEGLNLLSNLAKGTELWGEGRVLGTLGQRSDFELERDVVSRTASLFICVPEDMAAVYAPFLRVMVGLGLQAVTRAGKAGIAAERTLFMLDEAASLGHIPELEQGMGHLRAYARAVIVFQDLAQLKETYRKWQSVLANASWQVLMGVNEADMAEMVSKMLGDRTVETRSAGVNTGADTLLAHHQNAGTGEASRRLLQPAEVMRMGRDAALVFVRGLPHPILAERLAYFEERAFAGLWDRWRDGKVPAPVHVLLEHKPLAIEQKALRIEEKPLRLGWSAGK